MDENKEELVEKAEENAQAEELEQTEQAEAVEVKPAAEGKKKLGVKGLIAIVVAICVVFGAGVGVKQLKANKEADNAAAEAQTGETETTLSAKLPDMAAIWKTHESDEIVAAVCGHDVTWRGYFYQLNYVVVSVYNTFAQYNAYYGVDFNWTDAAGDDGTTYAQYVMEQPGVSIAQQYALEDFAAEKGYVLTEQDIADIDEQIEYLKTSWCGEGATDEDFDKVLEEQYLDRALLKRLVTNSIVYSSLKTYLYGENNEKVSDEDALKYLADNGYEYRCTHILFMTKDTSTGEALSDEAKAEKKAKADETYSQLAAIEDPQELAAKFSELKAELCEDSGKTAYPDGYVFGAGEMVEIFETTTAALGEYELSEPVESDYGYHIILRLPMDADALISSNGDGTGDTARSLCAEDAYATEIDEKIKAEQAGFAMVEKMNGYTIF